MERLDAAGHVSQHEAPPLQDTEHDGSVQTTSHVDSPLQETEPEVPWTVTEQLAPPEQSTLPDGPTSNVQRELSQRTLPLAPVVSVQESAPAHWALHDSAHVPAQLVAPEH